MNEEEKQAYFEKCRQQALEHCTIRTQEEFLARCREAGISGDWFGFQVGRSKPVSIEEDKVLYRKIGKTLVSYPFQRWDVAFEELLRYKKEYDTFVGAGALLRIDSVCWTSDAEILAGSGAAYPFVTIRRIDFAQTPEPSLLDDGWIFDNADPYMGYSNYHKTVRIDTLDGAIVLEFTKRTDERDRRAFGFADVYLRGSYRYPVPPDLRERVLRSVHAARDLNAGLRQELVRRFERTLPDEEYDALVRLQEEHLRALMQAIDATLSEKQQKRALADAGSRVQQMNPAADNIFGSRSHTILQRNFDAAYAAAGIARETAD